jgi:membrane-bound lytic murein transglycosylase A
MLLHMTHLRFSCFALLVFLSACATAPEKETPAISPAALTLTPVSYADLPGWDKDDVTAFGNAFRKSCARIEKQAPEKSFGPAGADWGTFGEWQTICGDFMVFNASAPMADFFESRLTPYAIKAGSEPEGLFTGYYESSLRGSRTKQGAYQFPLRAKPDDLVMVDLGAFRDELKGQRIAGRVLDGHLKPYETHAQINAGKLPPAQDKPLVWVDDAAQAFFVQIQGSGIVQLDDGSTMRIGYAGQNGHPYYAVGRDLVKRGALTKENVSMQSILDWMEKNPGEAQGLMETNPSYVFFRELDGEGPVGGEGIALTPHRSLAVDRSLIPYGLPLWLSAEHPDPAQPRIERLVVAQDTGGAIRGPVRGDIFWGYGMDAEKYAGVMKSKGRYWALLPKK